MPLNPIFWLLVLGVVAGLALTARRAALRKAMAEETLEGPIPGYSWTPGSRLVLEGAEGEPFPARPRAVETFHAPQRARVMVSLDLDQDQSGEQVISIMERVAREIYRRSEPHAVLVEGYIQKSSSPYLLLFAPDGRGWWGDEKVTRAHRGPEIETHWQ